MDEVTEHRVRRTLLGPPPWLIERYSVDGGSVTVSGWALSPDGAAEDWIFLVNGREPEFIRYPLASPSLGQFFPFCAGAAQAAFTMRFAVTDAEQALGHIEIRFVNRYSRLPGSDYFNHYIAIKGDSALAIPDEDQLLRTQGNRSPERYRLHGYTTFKRLELAVFRHSGQRLADFRSILDWGCGCGRLTQQLALELPAASLRGVDIDEANIRWCSANIAGARFDTVPLRPPTALPAGSFDLIIGISVMTHLDLATQHVWLQELARLIQPRGYVLLTTHGESALARVKSRDVLINTLAVGNDDTTPDEALNLFLHDKEYYRTSYHLQQFVRKLFAIYFDVVTIIPAANASLQDIIVLRSRA